MELGVSYIPAHLPDHIEADMRHLKEIGCTEVLFALQENHLVNLTGALEFGARLAKDKGLRPYAVVWGYANTFGGGRISKFLLDEPDVWRQDREGNRIPMACLNHPRLVARFLEIAEVCRERGYEGMFIDEPTVQTCFCPHCRRRFDARFGMDLAQSEGAEVYDTFRNETVHRYTEAVCEGVKRLDPALKTITCVMPCDRAVFEQVASIPALDVFGTDPYWLIPSMNLTIEAAIDYTRLVKAICAGRGKTSQVWLNCWRIRAGDEAEVYAGGRALAGVGCDSLYTWSYRGGLGTNEACDNPPAAWASVVRLYRELAPV